MTRTKQYATPEAFKHALETRIRKAANKAAMDMARYRQLLIFDRFLVAAAWFKRFPEEGRKTTGATLVGRAWAQASERIALLNRYEAFRYDQRRDAESGHFARVLRSVTGHRVAYRTLRQAGDSVGRGL